MIHTVTHFFLHADPLLICLIVAVVLMLESAGVPIANNTLLLLTGALASLGHLNIWILTIAAIVGSVAGACLAYWLGARGSRQLFLRIATFFRVKADKIEKAELWFQKSGVWMIFFSRMTPYIRPFACFPAGISKMPFPRFFVAALSGSVLWCVVLLAIGWGLGRRWSLALHMMQYYTIPTICLGIGAIALYFFVVYMIKRRLNFNSRLHATQTATGYSEKE